MLKMTCSQLTIWTLIAIALQIIGLSLFVIGFFPVKPALSGVSGPESYRLPTEDLADDFNMTFMAPEKIRSLYQEYSQHSASFDRLILMVIDGLPAEFVLGKDGQPPPKDLIDAMPYTQSLLSNGMGIGYHAEAAPPTVTMPRLKAMVSGAIGGFLDVVFNFNTQALLDDNLLDQFLRIGWKMVMLGDETWVKLFPQYFVRQDGVSSFFVKDTIQVDHNVSRHLPEELNQNDWHLLILHYLGLDHVGHTGGRKSALMIPKLKEMDEVIKMIHLNNILPSDEDRERTLLVVVSDHGMTDSGNHGGSSFEETDSLVLFIGLHNKFCGYTSATSNHAKQVDVTPTLAILFGVPIPKNNVGVLIAETLGSLTDDEKLRALELNSWQLYRLLQAQLPHLSCQTSALGIHDINQVSSFTCNKATLEEHFCCLFSKAAVLRNVWKSKQNSRPNLDIYNHTVTGYDAFLTTASEWLSRRVVEKPIGQLALGIAAMLLSCLVFLILLFCLRREDYVTQIWYSEDLKRSAQQWSLEETYVLSGVVVLISSMGSSSMIEEEQYIWHFLTTTLYLVLFCKRMQHHIFGVRTVRTSCPSQQYCNNLFDIIYIIALLLFARIMRGWHQGGVNWSHFPDISKWLEQSGSNWLKVVQVVAVLLVISFGLLAFSLSSNKNFFIILVKALFLGSALLVLQTVTISQTDTTMAQIIYGVLALLTSATALASPWIAEASISKELSTVIDQLSDTPVILERQWLLGRVKASLFLTGLAFLLCWSLLQLVLQQPIWTSMIYFGKSGQLYKQWIEVAALYFLGMSGHFGLGNTNTLATIDVAGAFIGISSHSTFLSGVLMFCITYASPMMVLLSLMIYNSMKETSSPGNCLNSDMEHLLKTMIGMPCVVLLGLNSVLLTAYTFILLQMRNHLFIWSVFSPKYLYVCATTACIYIGLSIVVTTELYIFWVCNKKRRELKSLKTPQLQ
ncbi:hypothetical protein V2J09_016486 [Rumex salicifolius]